MLKLVVLSALVAVAVADVAHLFSRPQFTQQRFAPVVSLAPVAPVLAARSPIAAGPESQAEVLRLASDVQPDGSYAYSYETSNGISAGESGSQVQVGNEQGTSAQGSFQYTAPDGQRVETNYVANENGFQAQGSHIPTPPPTPVAIQRALEWIAAHPQQPERRF